MFNKIIAAALLTVASIAPAAADGEKMIEIYHIAPGKHVEFLKLIAQYDEANRQAGLPARELYVHSDGGAWDFLTGAKFWVAIRQTIAEHTDTVATGPTTAGDWLKKLGD
jgi:hypothetical protein